MSERGVVESGFEPGLRFGKYELTRKLGEGGFGVVFVARDTQLDRDVAIKLLRPEHTRNADVVRRFLQEARSVVRVTHSGIVTIYECGVVERTGTPADGAAFIAMELLDGEVLSTRLSRRGRLPVAEAIELGRQLASALAAAHRAGIVHRDLKPDNIFLLHDLAFGERAKVLDFGIAKLANKAQDGAATHSHAVFGTPRYMSPEQCKSATSVDHRADIYSLGCILFEVLTGRPPFDGGVAELFAHHLTTPAPLIDRPGVPPGLVQLVAAMLAKRPEDRLDNMTEVERAFKSVAAPATSGSAGIAPTVDSLNVEPARSVPVAAPARSPTTLNSAAGVSAAPRSRSSRWWFAGISGAVVALIAMVAILRGGDSANPTSSNAASSSSLPPPPPPEVTSKPLAVGPPVVVQPTTTTTTAIGSASQEERPLRTSDNVSKRPQVAKQKLDVKQDSSAGCNEASCLARNHEGVCCAKFKKTTEPNKPAPVRPTREEDAFDH